MNNTKSIGNFADGRLKVTLKTRKNPIKLDNTIVPTLLVNRQYESEV
jgi:hypothetical protein